MAERRPIAGNKGGSALTMFSSSGLVFGVLQVSPRLHSFAPCIFSLIFRSPTFFCQHGRAQSILLPSGMCRLRPDALLLTANAPQYLWLAEVMPTPSASRCYESTGSDATDLCR